jgi:hypothetical protein
MREDLRDWLLQVVPKQSVCAEIGVYKGDFAARVWSVVQPRRLHLIDPWKYEASDVYRQSWYGGKMGVSQAHIDAIYETVLQRFNAQIATGTVRIHRASSSDAAASVPDAYFDWIYIDGNHQYEFVKRDLEHYFPKVKSGGYITGDDYGLVGWWQGGVTRAVDEFIAQGSCDVVGIRGAQFCLRKMG